MVRAAITSPSWTAEFPVTFRTKIGSATIWTQKAAELDICAIHNSRKSR